MKNYTNDLTTEIIKTCVQPPFTPEDIATFNDSVQHEVLEMITKVVTRPAKYMFKVATVGSRTRNGGILQKSSEKSSAVGLQVERVGDKVMYSDGSETTIISGAGEAHIMQGKSAALVGSMLYNDDEIISTPQSSNRLVLRESDTLPEGFLIMPGNMH
ncbi:PAAR domain-containing protein [Lelliottia amnigena]